MKHVGEQQRCELANIFPLLTNGGLRNEGQKARSLPRIFIFSRFIPLPAARLFDVALFSFGHETFVLLEPQQR